MWPDKAQYRPGEAVVLTAPGAASVLISELGHEIASLPVEDGVARIAAPPVRDRAPRGFRAVALSAAGEVIACTAFDVARHWSVAPRYGFFSEFKPTDTADAVAMFSRLHLNVAQFYDWMYTHYDYFAPTEEFVDPLGRSTSHRVVRERVEDCHRHGIACLAYGSLYGGEKPIAEQHPEWLLHDANGSPISLSDVFFIQNFERGCGWRELILGQYEEAVTRLAFDGIHIDQYGFPKRAVYRPGTGEERVVDLTAAFPDFVTEAGERILRLRPDGGNIFNCVNNWPVEQIAPLDADRATYIEVWPPHETYRDLHELIRHAKAAGSHKQVILAAYLHPFHREQDRPAGSINSLRLVTAAIHASGGFHLLLGEGDGVLADAYYPKFGRLASTELALVQRYYDFITAYGELLHDMDLRDVSYTWNSGINGDFVVAGAVNESPHAEPGKVWTIAWEKPGRRILHLINMAGLDHANWNAPQAEPTPVADLTVQLQVFGPIRAVWCASPDDGGAPVRLATEPVGDSGLSVKIRVPLLRFWNMIWTEE